MAAGGRTFQAKSTQCGEFLNFFFYELGYRGPTEGAKRYTISQEKHVAVDNDKLGPDDTPLVPTMHWRIEQHFKELEG